MDRNINSSNNNNDSSAKIPDSANYIRQMRLEKKASTIAARLHKCNVDYSRIHTIDQLKSLVSCQQSELSARLSNLAVAAGGSNSLNTNDASLANGGTVEAKKIMFQALLSQNNWQEKVENLFRNGKLKPENFKCEELRRMTPASLSKLLKRFVSTRKVTEALTKFNTSLSSTLTLPAVASTSTCMSSTFSTEDIENSVDVAEMLYAELLAFQKDYDTEATDSSSGGESCDEDDRCLEQLPQKFLHNNKKSRPIHVDVEERVSYRWRLERASIGSQVSFIKTQIQDLEHKIRQHNDLFRQLRSRKEICRSNQMNKTLAEHSSRTMPIESRGRTRIVRTAGMFRWNRKTARLSTVHCGCSPPFPPCAMCGGRVNNVQKVPDICAQSVQERASLVDNSYHPYLYDFEHRDISLSTRLQGYWKRQTVAGRSLAKNVILTDFDGTISGLAKTVKRNDDTGYQRRNHMKTMQSSSSTFNRKDVISSTMAQKLSSKAKNEWAKANGKFPMKRGPYNKTKLRALKQQRKRASFARKYSLNDSSSNSGASTPVSYVNGPTMPGKLAHHRRSTFSHNTYDIDNIVIDPSVAAMTRVEKLNYKEIVTPGWRVKEFEPMVNEASNGFDSNKLEELSDETFVKRHDEKELEEHKRFTTFKMSSSGRRLQSTTSMDFSCPSSAAISPCASEVALPVVPTSAEVR